MPLMKQTDSISLLLIYHIMHYKYFMDNNRLEQRDILGCPHWRPMFPILQSFNPLICHPLIHSSSQLPIHLSSHPHAFSFSYLSILLFPSSHDPILTTFRPTTSHFPSLYICIFTSIFPSFHPYPPPNFLPSADPPIFPTSYPSRFSSLI